MTGPLSITDQGGKKEESQWHTDRDETETAVSSEPVPAPMTKEGASEIPNGGMRAWSIVMGAWCTSFCSFGWINSIGVFQEYYESTLLKQYSTSTISWIPSLQIFFMTFLGPVVGIICDKYGPRHLLFIGTFLHVFGIMMTSISHEYYQVFLAQGVCSAIGVSMIFQPSLGLISQWFSTRRGAAFGILATGSSLGGVVFPIMVSHLIKQLSFGWAMRISGFLILALLIVANLVLRSRNPPPPYKLSAKTMAKPFREWAFAYLLIGLMLFTFGLYVPINFISVEAIAAGMNPDLAQYLIPILNAGSLFGRAASGFAGDKYGRYNVFIFVCYMSVIWIFALWIPAPNDAARIAFAALFGCFSGAYVALIVALVVQISPISEAGFRTGIVFCVTSVGGLSTNPVSGAILASSGGWLSPKIYSGVFALAGTCFIMAARINITGWKLLTVF